MGRQSVGPGETGRSRAVFLPAEPLKHELPTLPQCCHGRGKENRQELSAAHRPTLHSGHSHGDKPQRGAETSLRRERASCLLSSNHIPIPLSIPCFSCWGPPASPPPASESSRPAWDLPAKNTPGWGWKGRSKFPAWLCSLPQHVCLGSWTTAEVMLTCAVPQFPHPEATTPSVAGSCR